MTRLIKTVLVLAIQFGLGAFPARAQTNQDSRERIGLITNGPALLQAYRVTTTLISTQIIRLPARFATNTAYATNLNFSTNGVRIRMHTNVWSYTNLVFESFLPDSLAHLVWTNFMAHTNGRDMNIWATRTHPLNWPAHPPIVKWNTNSLIWGMRGLTALSPSWSGQGATGQVPLTALTGRHVDTRGHGMGPDGFRLEKGGRKAWFLAADNSLIEVQVKRAVVRIGPRTNQVHQDYTILLLDRDLPQTIEPMAVAAMEAVQKFYLKPSQGGTPFPIFQTEQSGAVSSGIPPLTVNTWKPGDSGSPNMIPLPGELVFINGRSTSGPTPEMQADMDELCRLEGLNPAKYQMRWVDLEKLTAK